MAMRGDVCLLSCAVLGVPAMPLATNLQLPVSQCVSSLPFFCFNALQ